jgi:hypothetical protein
MRVIQGTALRHLAVAGSAGLAAEPITDEPSFEMRQALPTDPKLAELAPAGESRATLLVRMNPGDLRSL